jgi:hypothetical protein
MTGTLPLPKDAAKILQGFRSGDSGVGLVVEDKERHVIFLGLA